MARKCRGGGGGYGGGLGGVEVNLLGILNPGRRCEENLKRQSSNRSDNYTVDGCLLARSKRAKLAGWPAAKKRPEFSFVPALLVAAIRRKGESTRTVLNHKYTHILMDHAYCVPSP